MEKKVAPIGCPAEQFVEHVIRFEPYCFQGEKFPPCDYDDPAAVRAFIGPYTLKASFVDSKGKPVKTASKPGRYGAIVEVHHSGKISKRFSTLCRMGGKVAGADVVAKPDSLVAAGIDPQVLEARRPGPFSPILERFERRLPGDGYEATLAAGLYDLTELKHAGKPLPEDTLVQLNRQWWVEFKRHYYGYDELYPKPFVCPKKTSGAAAPTVRQGSAAEAGMQPDAVETIDRACREWAEFAGVGFSLCIIRKGVAFFNRAYGTQADGTHKGEPFTIETAAPLASTTKFLSAILMSEFVDQGFLDFEDPIEKHVATLRGIQVKRSATVRDLYLHTAGFTGHWGDVLNDMEELVADVYPSLEVWKTHRYQGVGLALGGKIMEMMSGESIPRLFRNHLFGPLGVRKMVSECTPYGSTSTSSDLAVIGQMMLNGGDYGSMHFTSRKVIDKMMPIPGKDRFDPDKLIYWGVGMKLFDSDGMSKESFGHSGATGSFLKIDPAYDIVIAAGRHMEGTDYHKKRGALTKTILGAVKK